MLPGQVTDVNNPKSRRTEVGGQALSLVFAENIYCRLHCLSTGITAECKLVAA